MLFRRQHLDNLHTRHVLFAFGVLCFSILVRTLCIPFHISPAWSLRGRTGCTYGWRRRNRARRCHRELQSGLTQRACLAKLNSRAQHTEEDAAATVADAAATVADAETLGHLRRQRCGLLCPLCRRTLNRSFSLALLDLPHESQVLRRTRVAHTHEREHCHDHLCLHHIRPTVNLHDLQALEDIRTRRESTLDERRKAHQDNPFGDAAHVHGVLEGRARRPMRLGEATRVLLHVLIPKLVSFPAFKKFIPRLDDAELAGSSRIHAEDATRTALFAVLALLLQAALH